MNFVSGEMNLEFNIRFHVLGFLAQCEGNEMIQRVLVTGPHEDDNTKSDNPVF